LTFFIHFKFKKYHLYKILINNCQSNSLKRGIIIFKKLGENYTINNKKKFNSLGIFTQEEVKEAFEFAYEMSFGTGGEHRNHRSGGLTQRDNSEMFINTFQGKLAEVAFYKEAVKNGIELSKPDFEMYDLGKWDDADFEYKGDHISIKSAAYFSNLLLLETKDWDSKGVYIPNNKIYDYHFLVRISPDGKKKMKDYNLLNKKNVSKEELKEKISSENWEYDIPGCITNEDLISIIKSRNIIPQRAMLNGKIKMDAENYYIQCGDLREIK